MISLLSPCVDKLNQRNTLWRTVVQTYQLGINLSLCGPRVRFPCCTRSQSLADFQWKQQKYKKGRQTKLFFYCSSVCLVYLFCWKQPTTISALLKTENPHCSFASSFGLRKKLSFSFQWKKGHRKWPLILSATSKNTYIFNKMPLHLPKTAVNFDTVVDGQFFLTLT